jgi:hypothetical protein
VTQQIAASRRVNRRCSRGQALAAKPGAGSGQALSAKPGAVAGAAGSDFKARWARPGAGGGAGGRAMLAALCGLFPGKEKPGAGPG